MQISIILTYDLALSMCPLFQQVIDKPNTPSMSLDTITKGLTAAINAISDHPDVKVALGETH